MPNNVSPKPIERKTVRFGVKYGDFVLMYERIIEKPKPVEQVEVPKLKQLEIGGIDIYA
jgi:hypothetical protein